MKPKPVVHLQAIACADPSPETVQRWEGLVAGRVPFPAEVQEAPAHRRVQWLAARAAVLALLDAQGLDLRLGADPEHGFPVLHETSGRVQGQWHISLAHTPSLAVAALAPAAVGVDVERLDRSVARVQARAATPGELARFEAAALSPGGTFIAPGLALWCAKEAVAKATGWGMGSGMQRVVLEPLPPAGARARVLGTPPRALAHPAVQLSIVAGHLVAVCSEHGLLTP